MRYTVVLLALLLAGCATVSGNDQGGVIDESDAHRAFAMAQTHCQKYGKQARVTQIVPFTGPTTFACL